MDIDARLDPQRPRTFLHTVWINVEGKNTREGITVDEEKRERRRWKVRMGGMMKVRE